MNSPDYPFSTSENGSVANEYLEEKNINFEDVLSSKQESLERKKKGGLSDMTNIIKNKQSLNLMKAIKKPNNDNTKFSNDINSLFLDVKLRAKKLNLSDDAVKCNVNSDSSTQLSYIFKVIIDLSNSKKNERQNCDMMTEEERSNYESLLQKLESEIRNHIRIEQQLKMFGGSVQSRLEDLEKEKDQESKKNQAYLEKLKKENNDIKEKLKKRQNETDKLIKELAEKKDCYKTNCEKMKSLTKNLVKNQESNPKYPPNLKNSLNNAEFTDPQESLEKRKTSFSTISGSNKSITNSIPKPNEFKESSTKNSQFEHLSEKEREIFEYFQNKLNEKNKEVNHLQTQIKSLLEKQNPEKSTNLKTERDKSSEPKYSLYTDRSFVSKENNFEKSFNATDRNMYYMQAELSKNKDSRNIAKDKSYILENKTERSKIEEQNQKNKTSFLMQKNDENSNIRAGKSRSPKKFSETIGDKTRDQVMKPKDSDYNKKGSYIDFLNKNRNYLFHE